MSTFEDLSSLLALHYVLPFIALVSMFQNSFLSMPTVAFTISLSVKFTLLLRP